jgi:hypothetical protein
MILASGLCESSNLKVWGWKEHEISLKPAFPHGQELLQHTDFWEGESAYVAMETTSVLVS